jgi:hypothetical protein
VLHVFDDAFGAAEIGSVPDIRQDGEFAPANAAPRG